MTRIKYWLSGLALMACAVMAGLLAMEIGMRVFGISFPVFDTYDAERGLALRAGKQGIYDNEGEAFLSINDEGYRDKNHQVAKPSGVYRIAMLGDSFTEARQVELEETYWYQLADGLKTCPALAGRTIEVLNFGIGSYETAHSLLTLEKDVFKYQPDAVLLGFFAGNDIKGNSRKLSEGDSWRIDKPFFVIRDGNLVMDKPLSVSLFRRLLYEGIHYFRLLELVNEARRAMVVRGIQRAADNEGNTTVAIGTSDKVYLPSANDTWQQAWDLTGHMLARMNADASQQNARFAVLTIPDAIQVDPDKKRRAQFQKVLGVDDLFYPDRALGRIGQVQGFSVFELSPELQGRVDRSGKYMHGFANTALGYGHLNEYGHDLVSATLTPRVCKWISDAH